jgi:hypothetical protein
MTRDLNKLRQEMEAFVHEENLWKITGHVKNPSGNLCLHLVGNLNTYIGKNMGHTSYVRNRDAEFSLRDVPRSELINKVQQTNDMITQVFSTLRDHDLNEKYPENVLGYDMTTGFFLIHLSGHLSYHLGQINYLRRILE